MGMAARKLDLATVERGVAYALAVQSGDVPACRWVRLAVDRFFRDSAADSRWRFDAQRAAGMMEDVQRFSHFKGEKAGEKLRLEGWQCFALMNLFGFVDPATGLRRFREGFVFVPRGNGKTTLAAPVGLVMAFMEGEAAAEVYAAAVSRDQARICFDAARHMALRASPRVKSGRLSARAFSKVYGVDVQKHIIESSDGAVFKPLSRDAKSLDGLNVYLGILDELASHPTSEVYDAIKTGAAKRREPLILSITTATQNTAGIGHSTYSYATKVLEQTLEDERFFALMYTVDPDDDIWDPATWQKANPNWGISVDPDSFGATAQKAGQNASGEAAFKTRHLNVWEGAEQSMFSMKAWNACRRDVSMDDVAEHPCWIGVDLAQTTDLCAKVYLFDVDGVWHIFAKCYLPQQAIDDARVAQYPEWMKAGELVATPGAATDFDLVERELLADIERLNVKALGFDPWQAGQMMKHIEEETGALVYEVRPTVGHLSEACKELQRRHVGAGLAHDGNRVLAWCVANTVGKEDDNQNVKPTKTRNELKIDAAVAMIQAAACRLRTADEPEPEVYIL
jgi:phage terminase large subunit-like protein